MQKIKWVLSAVFFSILTTASAVADVASVLPHFYSEPGAQRFRKFAHSGETPDHVDPFSGSLRISHVDMVIPGNGGFDIKIMRNYSSNIWIDRPNVYSFRNYPDKLLSPSPTGAGWVMHMGRVVLAERSGSNPCETWQAGYIGDDTTNNAVLETPDGSSQALYVSITGIATFITNKLWAATCYGNNAGLTVYAPNGWKYTMNHRVYSQVEENYSGSAVYAWHPTRIEDGNGNSMTISYSGQLGSYALISQITTSDGRTVDFGYSGSMVTSISGAGQLWSYQYTSAGTSQGHMLLTSVSGPAGYSWSYTYRMGGPGSVAPWALDSVTNPYGGKTTYDYQHVNFLGTVGIVAGADPWLTPVVFSRTNSDGNWTYSYAPGPETDTTTVTTPMGTESYAHYSIQRPVARALQGLPIEYWKTGLLVDKTISGNGVTRNEKYSWGTNGVLSSEIHIVPPFSISEYDGVYYPSLMSKTITQDGASYTTTYSYSGGVIQPDSRAESGTGSRNVAMRWFPYSTTGVWLVDMLAGEQISGAGGNFTSYKQYNYTNGNIDWQNIFGQYKSFTHTSQGDVNAETDARGNAVIYSNYAYGVPRNEAHPVDGTNTININRSVGLNGTIDSEQNGRGYTTTYRYDGLNRITEINRPLGERVSIIWGSNSRKVVRGSYTEFTTFDDRGRVDCVDVTNGSDHVTKLFRYDAKGNKSFESLPFSGSCTGATGPISMPPGERFDNDVLGRVHTQTHSDGTAIHYSYNNGMVQVTDENGKITRYVYREFGEPLNTKDRQLMRIDAPENVSTVFERNLIGQVLTVTQGTRDVNGVIANGVTRTYTYDPITNFLLSVYNPETGLTTYTRDEVGNMTSRKVGSSDPAGFYYDRSNRLTVVDYPGFTPDTLYSYDNNGNVTSVLTDTGWIQASGLGLLFTDTMTSRTYTYDENDNLKSEQVKYEVQLNDGGTQSLMERKILNVGYNYNMLDMLDNMTYPSGQVVSFSPDALGRVTRVGNYVNSVGYHPSGHVSSLAYANGVSTSVDLSERLWPRRITASGGRVDLSYAYDGAGNVLSITNGIESQYSQSMTYDGLNRLQTATGSWGNGLITYDSLGNISSKTLGADSLSYSYDNLNRLSAVNGSRYYAFSYDFYGNVVSNNQSLFTYNDAGDMTGVSGGASKTHVYDADHRRLRTESAQKATYHLYSKSGLLLGDYQKGSTQYTEYMYLGSRLVASTGYVLIPPVALAGQDQSQFEGTVINLDGTASRDTDGTIVSYNWTQTAGPIVTLNNANTATPSFTAPAVTQNTVLTFSLTVADNDSLTAAATVNVTVLDWDADSDGDGLPDAWEMLHFKSLAFGPNDDNDADGIPNWQELQEGTNPTMPEPAPVAVTTITANGGNGQNVISWKGVKSVAHYDLYWNTSPGVTTTTGNKIANVTSPYYHGTIPNNMAYYYILVAANNSGQSVSAEVRAIPSSPVWQVAEKRQSNSVYTSHDVALSSNGDGFVVWSQNDGATYSLQVARRTQVGGWSAPVVLAANLPGNSIPHLAVNDVGQAALVWEQWDGTRHNLWASLFLDTASGWSVPVLLEAVNGTYSNVTNSRVVMSNTGQTIVTWIQDEARGGFVSPNLFGNTYTPGSGWSGRVMLDQSDTAFTYANELLLDSQGVATVVWQRETQSTATLPYDNLYSRRFLPAKGWQPTVTVDTVADAVSRHHTDLRAATYGAGKVFVYWRNADITTTLYGRHFENGAWGNRVTLGTNTTYTDPVVVGDGAGSLTLVWREPGSGSSWNLMSRRYSAGVWSGAVKAASDAFISPVIRLGVDARGNVTALFVSNTSKGTPTLYVTTLASGATAWSARVTLDTNVSSILTGVSNERYFAVNGLGDALAGWEKSDGTVNNFWTKFYIVPSNIPPVANAGPDQTVKQKTLVSMNGAGSYDADGTVASYLWRQTAGTAVTLTGANTATPSFTAPAVTKTVTLTFTLTVTDNQGAVSTADPIVVSVTK